MQTKNIFQNPGGELRSLHPCVYLQWSTLQWLPCSACAHTKGLNLTIGWHHGWPPACVWALMCCWISRSWHLAHTWRACLVWVGEPDKYLACLPGLGWRTWLIPGVPILSHPPSPNKPNPFIRNSFPLPQGCKNADGKQDEFFCFFLQKSIGRIITETLTRGKFLLRFILKHAKSLLTSKSLTP